MNVHKVSLIGLAVCLLLAFSCCDSPVDNVGVETIRFEAPGSPFLAKQKKDRWCETMGSNIEIISESITQMPVPVGHGLLDRYCITIRYRMVDK